MPKRKRKKKTKSGDRPEDLPPELQFDYVKSNFFRVVHADGVFGGITPNGLIHMDFWNQRFPIPKHVIHPLEPDGTLGPEIREKRLSRDTNVVREVEVGIVVDPRAASELIAWLQDKLDQLQGIAPDNDGGDK